MQDLSLPLASLSTLATSTDPLWARKPAGQTTLSTVSTLPFPPTRQQHAQQQQVRFRSNRSRRGMYDGKDIKFGNKVSFSARKSRRSFKPNVFLKRVYSEVLDEMIKFHLTSSTLRSIDKAGGLDQYLLKSKKIQEGEGLVAKERVLAKLAEQQEAGVPDWVEKIVIPESETEEGEDGPEIGGSDTIGKAEAKTISSSD